VVRRQEVLVAALDDFRDGDLGLPGTGLAQIICDP
jgi:hypothetical protein